MLQVKEVTHSYGRRKWLGRSEPRPPVLADVSLTIESGFCLGLLGTSGAGKSTLGKVILGLEKPQEGQVLFRGQDIYNGSQQVRRGLRRDMQVVFQDCYSAVNPRMTAGQIIGEPLDNYERLSVQEQKRTVENLLERVGLKPEDRNKYPHQFSGGQLQRINIARAIALKPKLIVLDESVSSLDMVHQMHILSLLGELKSSFGLSYLFITHDIRAAYAVCDGIAVMEQGRLIERCDEKDRIFESTHPAVQRLISSILPEHPADRLPLHG